MPSNVAPINHSYANLAKYLILTDPNTNNSDNTTTLIRDFPNFIAVTDSYFHHNINFQDIRFSYPIKSVARKYKTLPARSQISEVLLFRKALHLAMNNKSVGLNDFVLFALPQVQLTKDFDVKLAAILNYIQKPEFSHIDCIILDYGHLDDTIDLISLIDKDIKSSKQDKYQVLANQLQQTHAVNHLSLFTDSIQSITVDLNLYNPDCVTTVNSQDSNKYTIINSDCSQNCKYTFTIATPTKMGITYSHCFLIRRSRIPKIVKKAKPCWLFSDIKSFVPIARILIVTPNLAVTAYPEYDLHNSSEDILELNRRRICHLQPIDKYRHCIHKLCPWLHRSLTKPKNSKIYKFSHLLQKLLLIDF